MIAASPWAPPHVTITPGDGNGATAHGGTTSVFTTARCTTLHSSASRRFAFLPTNLLTRDQGMWVTNLYNGLAFLFSEPLNCELCISRKKIKFQSYGYRVRN